MPGPSIPVPWPVVASFLGATLPALAAARARTSFTRDPAGQAAAGWLVMAGCTLASTVASAVLRDLSLLFLTTAATIVIHPLVLIPPVLTWAGPAAKRRQGAILAGAAAAGGVALAAIGPGRRFQAIAHPAMCLLMSVLLLLALRTQMERHAARHGAREPLRAGWLWLIGGHLAYFLSSIPWFPLLETLALRGMQLAADAHLGVVLLHSGAMGAIAYGVALAGADGPAAARA